MTTNEPSIAVLERNGFQRERTLPGFRLARGIPRDFYLYSVGSRAAGQPERQRAAGCVLPRGS
jgi:hypothetical protein